MTAKKSPAPKKAATPKAPEPKGFTAEEGAQARNDTMAPEPRQASGQTGTVSKPSNG
jgi:hypothetical protein